MPQLEDIIIGNEINRQNLWLLKDEFDKNVSIPFIGAGCSETLGEPCWLDLFKQLKSQHNAKTKLRKVNGANDFPGAFSRLYKEINIGPNFYTDIFKLLEPKKIRLGGAHLKIVDACSSYVTTNYDDAIDEAFLNQKRMSANRYYFFCPRPDINLKNSIVYLHGHKDIKFCIIRTEDFEYFYPTVSKKTGINVLEDFIEYIYKQKSIVFVGFSFADKYIRTLINHLKTRSNSDDIRYKHFLIVDEENEEYRRHKEKSEYYNKNGHTNMAQDEIKKFYLEFMDIRIYPIIHRRGYHVFTSDLFDLLAKKKTSAIEPKPISGEPV